MNNEFIDLGYVKNLIIKNRIIIIVTMAICLCLGVLFSINNSFIYQAETSLIFGRIKPQEHAISSIVENEVVNNSTEMPVEPNIENQEVTTEEENTSAAPSPEQNISLTNVNIDYNTLKTCQALIKSDNLIDKLKNELGIEDSTASLKNSISITKLQTSNVLVITTNNKNGDKACDITNKMAQLFATEAKNIYNLDSVYIIDAADYNDVTRTGLNIGFILLGLLIGIVLSCAIVVARQFNYVNNAINKLSHFCKEKYSAIVRFVNSKVHKVEIRELPSGEELDENYKVVSNVSIIDSDLVSPEQPKIDNIISTDIEEFNSKTDYYDESVNSIPMTDKSEKIVVEDENKVETVKKQEAPAKAEKEEKISIEENNVEAKDDILTKIKNKYKKAEPKSDVAQQVESDDKKNIKKIGKEEAMSIKAQEELIALREENNQKIRQDRDRIDDQAHIQKRLNEEIEARKKLELELENQKKALEEERRTMEERIMKELQKQIQEEQRKAQEEEERLAYEIEMREQEEEQRIMEEERLKMLREKEERKEQLRQEKIEKRIIKDEIRKKKQ
jgi:capsular polysaccharide biosynthesis protein